MKETVVIFSLLLTLSPAALRAQEKSMHPRFTEFCTDEEHLNDTWHCKITTTDTLANHIIQLVSSKEVSDYYSQWVCLQIFDKLTGQFMQEIDIKEYYHSSGSDWIQVDDYNFDEYEDFSLWGGFGTLDNSFSFYFLFDPETKTFFDSGFDGTNLEFHSDSKTITSSNRCCAGSEEFYATYKLLDNRMVLLEQHRLSAARGEETGKVFYDDEKGYITFEETDSGTPYYLDVQLQSVGLNKGFQLRMAVYDEDRAGGFVQYAGKKERIPIHFDRLEKIQDTEKLYYNEMYDNKINGIYFFTLRGTSVDNAGYIRKKDSKIFDLEIAANNDENENEDVSE